MVLSIARDALRERRFPALCRSQDHQGAPAIKVLTAANRQTQAVQPHNHDYSTGTATTICQALQ